jgi:hypothetical protein
MKLPPSLRLAAPAVALASASASFAVALEADWLDMSMLSAQTAGLV